MSLHHLDPRQAGTGAAPDVDVYAYSQQRAWGYTDRVGGTLHGERFATEAAALAAAREAAGFGHVAEKPCDAWNHGYLAGHKECSECHWRWDAHQNHPEGPHTNRDARKGIAALSAGLNATTHKEGD